MIMNAPRAESLLALLYSSSAVLSVVSIVSLAVAWQYWTWTLDVCINIDCGCILYGVTTFSTFMGGDVKLCHFGTFALLPVLFIGLSFAVYHGYRSCIRKGLDDPRVLSEATYCSRNTNDGEMVVVSSKQRPPFKQWMSASFLAALICCLSLAHAVVLTDGYYKTCEQYKRSLVKLLGSRGREVQAIYNRLSCGAILDFMDYLQPDTNNWVRGEEINTAVALQLAIVTTWFNVFSWIGISAVNFFMGRKRVHSLGEKVCCCC